mgnify:FL=1
MSDKLYELMDWPEIEAVVYSEEYAPREILGPHVTGDGVLVQCFFPGADKVTVKTTKDGREYPMSKEDDAGYFAVLLSGRKIPEYTYLVEQEGEQIECYDAYAFPCQITLEEEQKFINGICYDIYEKLGAHPMTVNGVDGVYFAVWAPNAARVSVVGDFNHWDGRVYQMQRLSVSGIYELFIPQIPVGSLYKYELKLKDGLTYLKADPYANQAELRPATASVVADLTKYIWKDQTWMKERKKIQTEDAPMFVYEMHLASWKKPEDGREFYNYRELAPMIVAYVKEMGYTHVELMPVMEHPFDASWGYQVTGYYAPTSRYGSPEDFMYFVDTLHQAGIGVILDWVPAHFPRDTFGLANFDGTCLYEHLDPRQGYHPHWGTLIYNYGRPQVKNFLIANALFWTEKFHADGIRFDAVASMLYLDYGKNDGEWVANIYGGNENLDAVELLKHLNSIFKKKHPDALLIAEESTAWPRVTGSVDTEDGLGFDYKWNMGWMNDFVGYMSNDPYFRGAHHNELTFSMVYAYSERFMLSLSHDEVVHQKGSLLEKMPGTEDKKFANLRAAYGFFMTHPGKKLLFMGQEYGQVHEWAENKALDWEDLEKPAHRQMQNYMKALIQLYKTHPALWKLDYDSDGFEWINCVEWEKSMVTFLRKSQKQEDTLVVICNFSDVAYEEELVGVPYAGKYKEILNSDAKEYGGTGVVNPRVKIAKKEETDDRPYTIKVKVAPLSVAIYSFTKTAAKTSTNRTAKTAKKTAGKAEGKTLSATEKKEGLRKVIQQKLETAEKKGAEEKEKRTAKEAEAAKKPKEKKKVTAKKETETE